MAGTSRKKILGQLKAHRIIYPIIIGLAVVSYFFIKDFNKEAWSLVRFTHQSIFWIMAALLLMVSRDISYMIRIKILTDGALSWKQAFNIIFLWEFTSSITPSMIGGTGAAIIFLNKEGISVGNSTAVVMATAFLDELYQIIMFVALLLVLTPGVMFDFGDQTSGEVLTMNNRYFVFVMVGFFLVSLYTFFLIYGLFFNPKGVKWIMVGIFNLPFLKKWKKAAIDAGDDLILSSKIFKQKSFIFWLKAFGSTFLSWTSRFWVVNCILLAFFPVSDHLLIFARQLVMWILMIVSPTPGGSGFAEFIFSKYLGEFMPIGFALAMALLWRMISYYPYLFIGAVLFPRWIKSKFFKKKKA